MRQGAIGQHVFTPYHGIAQQNDVRRADPLEAPLVKPVVLAQNVRDSVIRSGIEAFESFPKQRGQRYDQEDDPKHRGPVPGVQAHVVDERRFGNIGWVRFCHFKTENR